MTDPTPPLSDEDLSAVLDGEATPDVVARVQADPRARARLDAFRRVATSVGRAPVDPLAPSTVDDLVARALAEASGPAAATYPPPTGDPVVTPLAPPRGNRPAPRWLVAAAIVALVAIGLGLVWSGTNDGDADTLAGSGTPNGADEADGGAESASDASESPDEPLESEGPGVGAQPANPAVPTTTAAGDDDLVGDLGTFADADELRTALARSFPSASTLTRGTIDRDDASLARCDQLNREVFEIDDGPTETAVATVDGDELFVFEYERVSFADETTPTTVVTAVAPDTCDQVLTFER